MFFQAIISFFIFVILAYGGYKLILRVLAVEEPTYEEVEDKIDELNKRKEELEALTQEIEVTKELVEVTKTLDDYKKLLSEMENPE